MKENQPPLFAKLFLPEKEKIDEKQVISSWGKPHPKQFHVIDNPSIINRIATQINQNRRQYNSAKISTQPSELSKNKRPLYVVKKTKKASERIKFGKLNQEVNCLSDFIENQVSDLNLSEVFQYKQKMLTTFLQSFFEELAEQCHQKANFIKQIWNQAITLFDRIFQKQNQTSLNYEKNSLKEIINLHKSYHEFFEKLKKEKQELINERQKFKDIIKSLVRNIRERCKQIKMYKGGIQDYNNKLYSLSVQLDELKRQHIDILMYGYDGSMSRQEAENMLMNILKPVHEDEEDLREELSIKHIPTTNKKEIYEDETFIKSSYDCNPLIPEQLNSPEQTHEVSKLVQPISAQVEFNFIPKKKKLKQRCQLADVKTQTEFDDFIKVKVNQHTQSGYFQRMENLAIKNKYCQTEIKKTFKINGFCQTDQSGIDAFREQKRMKLEISGNLINFTSKHSCKKMKAEFKSSKFNTTLTYLKSQAQIEEDDLSEEDSEDEKSVKQKQKQVRTIKEIEEKRKQQRKPQKHKSSYKNSKKLTRIQQSMENSKVTVQKSKKVRIKTKPQENLEQSKLKTFQKTQNFIKLNKVRVSAETKHKITQIFFSNIKNILPEASSEQKNVELIKCYFNINEGLDIQRSNERDERYSTKSIQRQESNHLIFLGQNWSNRFFKTLNKIRNHPSEKELELAYFFNTKSGKNKNMGVENSEYIEKLKPFVSSLDMNSTLKKNQINAVATQYQTFTLKKSYKIIEEIFQLCLKIREQKDFMNINFIEILDRLFCPNLSAQSNSSSGQNSNQHRYSEKTMQFLKYMIRNMNENYLFKNFLFLCGINYKLGEGSYKQAGIVNINKTTQIGEKEGTKKTIHIEAAIRSQIMDQQKKDIENQHYGTLIYSSEIIFYLDMFKTLNCYSNSVTDIANSYTNLDMLQSQFQKIPKYFKDEKLITKIKDVIEDCLRPSALNSSKLNIFKILQIFLEKIRQRKIEMIHSYSGLYNFLREKFDSHINEYILVEILTLIKVPPETQLKIMSRMFKKYESEGNLEDLATFFVNEGFPDVELLNQGLTRSQKQYQSINLMGYPKSNNLVLDYLKELKERRKNPKSGKFFNQLSESLKLQENIESQVSLILGKDLDKMQIVHIMMSSSE